jgi:hypothetical protein
MYELLINDGRVIDPAQNIDDKEAPYRRLA